jgi:GNAT superfamily N-acetyltransferase
VVIRPLNSAAEFEDAAELALDSHRALVSQLPFLSPRTRSEFRSRIEWVAARGIVMGSYTEEGLTGFLGAFPIKNFRHAGPGSFGPDWCHGLSRGGQAGVLYPLLYRELARQLLETGIRLHAFSFYASQMGGLEAMTLSGFGRIVCDAAVETSELLDVLPQAKTDTEIRAANESDIPSLCRMDKGLAEHIGASPVLMPGVRGRGPSFWSDWLSRPTTTACLALKNGRPVGFIKAEDPQDDVSFSVHGESTLAINGMYVDPGERRAGVGRALLLFLARQAEEGGKTVVSVDCETTNPEAYAFWTRWFRPVAYGMERRV